jgi:superfamily I DNA/RNA helicase
MSIIFFEGSAGTGKTTSLMRELENQLTQFPLQDEQRVLGLTFMHGSRRRLIERFSHLEGLRKRFDCLTFDSFAWHLVNRWKSLARLIDPQSLNSDYKNYEQTCSLAAHLLENSTVGLWVSRSYPVIVIDETQDCKDGRLEIVRQLSNYAKILAAGDDFQNLQGTGPSPAIQWLRSVTQPQVLTINHRTNNQCLINAAQAVYNSGSLANGKGFFVLSSPNKDVAAFQIARNLIWNKGLSNTVLLTPTKPNNAPFVREAVQRLMDAPLDINKNGKPVGPFRIDWEMDLEVLQETLIQTIGLPNGMDLIINVNSLNLQSKDQGVEELKSWLDYQRKTRGVQEFSIKDLLDQIYRITQRIRAYKCESDGLRAMTIPQAKNREFDGVVVLWPFAIGGTAETQRRLLYNAITRAKRWAVVIIQDNPKKSRLPLPPFNITNSK